MDGSNSGPESSGPFRGFQFEPGVALPRGCGKPKVFGKTNFLFFKS